MKRKREESSIETLDDLINFAWNCDQDKKYWFSLWKTIPYLEELRNMIGMESLKQQIISMILYYLGDFHIIRDIDGVKCDNHEMIHMVLYGPPGCGKTTIVNIIANIFYSLGILKSKNIVRAKKTDFISQYIGGSETKTKNILNKVIKNNSILVIDEVYSFGSRSIDSFSKIIIDLLNQYLSEHGKDFMCIIAGYKKEIQENFFSVNQGLERRFPWRIEIEPYTSNELYNMFLHKSKKEGWTIEDNIICPNDFDIVKFPNSGGDIDTLFLKCKMVHTRRIFGKPPETHKIITQNDFKRAYSLFIENSNKDNTSHLMMYS